MADDTQLDRAFDSILRRQESLLERPLRANFDQLSKDILLAWQQHGENGAKAVVALNDIALAEILKAAYHRGIITGNKLADKQIGNKDPIVAQEVISQTLLWIESQAEITAKQINRTTEREFNKLINRVMNEQKSINDIEYKDIVSFLGSAVNKVKDIAKLLRVTNFTRARTVSTTEAQKSIQLGVQKTADVIEFRQGAVVLKTWKTQGDSKVRDSHARVNGQQKRIGEMFLVGAGRGLHPQATTLPLDEKINCRCYMKLSKQMT